jgi:hypothetical protein
MQVACSVPRRVARSWYGAPLTARALTPTQGKSVCRTSASVTRRAQRRLGASPGQTTPARLRGFGESDQQCVGELADVAEAGDPEPGTGALAEPMPWPGEAALGMLELPDIGGALATDPELLGTVASGAA